MTDQELAAAIEEVGGRVLIGFREPGASDGVDEEGRVLVSRARVESSRAALRGMGVTIRYEFQKVPAVAATMPSELVSAIRSNPFVDYLEPSGRLTLDFLGPDTRFGPFEDVAGAGSIGPARLRRLLSQTTPWNVTAVGAPSVWNKTTGSGVKLLVLDSGTPPQGHADLYFPVAWGCIQTPVEDTFYVGHGTAVSGVAAALDNTVHVVGVAPGVSLWSGNVIGDPEVDYTADEAYCSLDLARINNVDIVNMSFGLDSPSTLMTDEINGGYNYDNMLFVASVGNTNGGSVRYPASLSNVIGVTAVNSQMQAAGFAAVGSQVELSAPGVSVYTTIIGETDYRTGTSYAAPHVAAAAALLRARYPGWSNATIRQRLRETATDLGASGFDNTYGYGFLDIPKAMGMQVAVHGPSVVDSGSSETWYASVSGGQTPYSYAWAVDGEPAGTGSSLQVALDSSVTISLWVTDDNNLGAGGGIVVTVVPPCDPDCTEETASAGALWERRLGSPGVLAMSIRPVRWANSSSGAIAHASQLDGYALAPRRPAG